MKYLIQRSVMLLMLLTAFGLAAQEQPRFDDPLAERLYNLGFGVPPAPFDAPDFTIPDLKGNQVRLSSLKGKLVLLNFWATWCPPCRSEMPAMETLYGELRDEGFEILAVSSRDARETKEKVAAYIAESGYTFPVLFDQTASAVPTTYRTGSIPTSYLINAEGKVVARLIGAYEWDADEIIELLREMTPR